MNNKYFASLSALSLAVMLGVGMATAPGCGSDDTPPLTGAPDVGSDGDGGDSDGGDNDGGDNGDGSGTTCQAAPTCTSDNVVNGICDPAVGQCDASNGEFEVEGVCFSVDDCTCRAAKVVGGDGVCIRDRSFCQGAASREGTECVCRFGGEYPNCNASAPKEPCKDGQLRRGGEDGDGTCHYPGQLAFGWAAGCRLADLQGAFVSDDPAVQFPTAALPLDVEVGGPGWWKQIDNLDKVTAAGDNIFQVAIRNGCLAEALFLSEQDDNYEGVDFLSEENKADNLKIVEDCLPSEEDPDKKFPDYCGKDTLSESVLLLLQAFIERGNLDCSTASMKEFFLETLQSSVSIDRENLRGAEISAVGIAQGLDSQFVPKVNPFLDLVKLLLDEDVCDADPNMTFKASIQDHEVRDLEGNEILQDVPVVLLTLGYELKGERVSLRVSTSPAPWDELDFAIPTLEALASTGELKKGADTMVFHKLVMNEPFPPDIAMEFYDCAFPVLNEGDDIADCIVFFPFLLPEEQREEVQEVSLEFLWNGSGLDELTQTLKENDDEFIYFMNSTSAWRIIAPEYGFYSGGGIPPECNITGLTKAGGADPLPEFLEKRVCYDCETPEKLFGS